VNSDIGELGINLGINNFFYLIIIYNIVICYREMKNSEDVFNNLRAIYSGAMDNIYSFSPAKLDDFKERIKSIVEDEKVVHEIFDFEYPEFKNYTIEDKQKKFNEKSDIEDDMWNYLLANDTVIFKKHSKDWKDIYYIYKYILFFLKYIIKYTKIHSAEWDKINTLHGISIEIRYTDKLYSMLLPEEKRLYKNVILTREALDAWKETQSQGGKHKKRKSRKSRKHKKRKSRKSYRRKRR
jgi:hypothetical protein